MRKTLLIISLLIGITSYAQIVDYSGFGVLLSTDNSQGTARNTAMKNAFGALGGDLSSMNVNPASGAIFTHSNAAFTLGYEEKRISSEFYGSTHDNTADNFNFSQAGGLLIFDNNNGDNGLQKITFGLNYQIINNFKNNWIASGISIATLEEDPNDENIHYSNVENQTYTNTTEGKHDQLNFSIAALYNNNLYVGASLNTYNVEYSEEGIRKERANDGNGNTVDAYERFWLDSTGEGFSLGLGVIYKITQSFRLGFSYNSPVWYEISEESNMYEENEDDSIGYVEILYSNDPPAYNNNYDKVLAFDYNLRTPSKLTGSIAYVFGKNGLISADVIRKNYKGINLSPNKDFTEKNKYIDTNLTNTYAVNLGTEWRIDKFSIRSGYSYEQSPYKDAIDSDNPIGYSLGAGYNFDKFSLDFAYNHSEQTDYFNFYSDLNGIDAANLNKDNNKFIMTLRFNL